MERSRRLVEAFPDLYRETKEPCLLVTARKDAVVPEIVSGAKQKDERSRTPNDQACAPFSLPDEERMAVEKSPEEAKVVAGLSCPRCQAAQVTALPPNGMSRKPGYRCLTCGARMRGATVIYLVAAVLGLGLLSVAAGALAPLRGQLAVDSIQDLVRAPMGPGSGFIGIPLYVVVAGYSIMELLRPRPRRL